jgi:hypothetical protein
MCLEAAQSAYLFGIFWHRILLDVPRSLGAEQLPRELLLECRCDWSWKTEIVEATVKVEFFALGS